MTKVYGKHQNVQISWVNTNLRLVAELLFRFLDEEESITKSKNSNIEKTSAKMRKFRWKGVDRGGWFKFHNLAPTTNYYTVKKS